jgi:hypothetical protein
MASRTLTILTAALLALSGSAAFAQMDTPRTGFYADPVLPDPSPIPAHVYPAKDVTAGVAAVTPAAGTAKPQRMAACTAKSPCAVVAPPARG